MIQCGFIQKVSFFTFSAGITDHASGSSNQCNWLMPCPLQMYQEKNGHKTSYVQAVGCRIKPDVTGGHFPGKLFFRTGHYILYHAPPFQLWYKRHKLFCEFWQK